MGTISVQSLRKEFVSDDSTVIALENASFEVSGREFVSVVGPSGCGKSTLLNILSGIETPTSGVVEITEGDREAWSRSPRATARRGSATCSRPRGCCRGGR